MTTISGQFVHLGIRAQQVVDPNADLPLTAIQGRGLTALCAFLLFFVAMRIFQIAQEENGGLTAWIGGGIVLVISLLCGWVAYIWQV